MCHLPMNSKSRFVWMKLKVHSFIDSLASSYVIQSSRYFRTERIINLIKNIGNTSIELNIISFDNTSEQQNFCGDQFIIKFRRFPLSSRFLFFLTPLPTVVHEVVELLI